MRYDSKICSNPMISRQANQNQSKSNHVTLNIIKSDTESYQVNRNRIKLNDKQIKYI